MSSSAPSSWTTCSTAGTSRRAACTVSRKWRSVTTTRLPALRNWWATCSGVRRVVDRERHRAEVQDGGVDEVELGPVEQHQRDRVAALDPERGEPGRDPLDALGVLAPGDRDRVARVAQRDLVGALGGGELERVAERRRVERRGRAAAAGAARGGP